MADKFHDECAVMGVYGHPEAANMVYLGLYALQHRGQESCGIVSSDGKGLISHRQMGLVADAFKEDVIKRLEGSSAIGHNRYSTQGQSHLKNAQPFVVEYYYRTKWGHADEFLRLFKKNHYPLLKKEVEMGRMLKVWMDQPRYHTTEDGRWDYRVTIVFKNSTVANEPFEEEALKKQLWPDQAAYEREEQRRFEILDAHWDLPVKTLDLEK